MKFITNQVTKQQISIAFSVTSEIHNFSKQTLPPSLVLKEELHVFKKNA